MKYYVGEPGKHPLLGLFRSTDLGEDIWYDKGDEFVIPSGEDDGKYDVFAIRDGKVVGSRLDTKSFKLNNHTFKGLKLFGLFRKHAKLTIMAVYRPDSFSKSERLTYGIPPRHCFEKDINGVKVTLSCYFAIWPDSISAQSILKAKANGFFNKTYVPIYKESQKVARFVETYTSNHVATRLLGGEFNDLVTKNLFPNIPDMAYVSIDRDDPRSMEFAEKLAEAVSRDLDATGVHYTIKVLPAGCMPAGLDGSKEVFVATGRSLNSQYL